MHTKRTQGSATTPMTDVPGIARAIIHSHRPISAAIASVMGEVATFKGVNFTPLTDPKPEGAIDRGLIEAIGAMPIETLGLVYEYLLSGVADGESGGSPAERKNTGSFYTPPAVVAAVLDRTLEPYLDRRFAKCSTSEERERAILSTTICDPSCGVGYFLLEAVDRLVHRLTEARGTDDRAAADVIASCIFGVDIDPVAVALCRYALALRGGEREYESNSRGETMSGIVVADAVEVGALRACRRTSFDVVVGNPPFLFGKRRPALQTDRFTLAHGAWDTSWLFIEDAIRSTAPNGAIGLVAPESIAVRTSSAAVRSFVCAHAELIDLIWTGAVFDAEIAPVAWVIHKGRPQGDPEVRGFSLSLSGVASREVPASFFWRPGSTFDAGDSGDRLCDIATIEIGEVDGKRSLVRLRDDDTAEFPVMTGESVRGPVDQAVPTHDLGHAPRKCTDRYKSPKVLLVKTGRAIRVGIDYQDLPTLQSVYCLRVTPFGVERGWTADLLAKALADPDVTDRYIRPHTEGKSVFPQITITMLREISLAQPSDQSHAKTT